MPIIIPPGVAPVVYVYENVDIGLGATGERASVGCCWACEVEDEEVAWKWVCKGGRVERSGFGGAVDAGGDGTAEGEEVELGDASVRIGRGGGGAGWDAVEVVVDADEVDGCG